jgi:hypothetical protein
MISFHQILSFFDQKKTWDFLEFFFLVKTEFISLMFWENSPNFGYQKIEKTKP